MNIKHLIKNAFSLRKKQGSSAVVFYPEKNNIQGRVLFSYLISPFFLSQKEKNLWGHSNAWESLEIVRIFNELGFIVDGIEWTDSSFYPTQSYDVLFDIDVNLQRLMPFVNKDIVKILHLTESYHFYHCAAELARVEQLEVRRSCFYNPKRSTAYIYLRERSLRIAEHCSLLGNEFTHLTYPELYQKKITLVPVSASQLNFYKSAQDYLQGREFLWHYGGGAVHKGLDLVLEVFARNKHLVLNIIGRLDSERDFLKIYKKELTEFPNIKYHGYLVPSDKKFIEIIKKCFCFVASSCSESTSAAVVTCLQLGLYPIISRQNGVTLPIGTGMYLETCSIDEIEHVVATVHQMKEFDLVCQIAQTQEYAFKNFSRGNFTHHMTNFLKKSLGL